jgi:hypothetical protein
MSFVIHKSPFPGLAASPITAGQPVKVGTAGERQVIPVTADTEEIFGVTDRDGVSALTGDAVTVHEPGETVKAIAAASIAGGAKVSWANASAGFVAGASGKQSVGLNVSGPVVPGDVFALYIRPGGITA